MHLADKLSEEVISQVLGGLFDFENDASLGQIEKENLSDKFVATIVLQVNRCAISTHSRIYL